MGAGGNCIGACGDVIYGYTMHRLRALMRLLLGVATAREVLRVGCSQCRLVVAVQVLVLMPVQMSVRETQSKAVPLLHWSSHKSHAPLGRPWNGDC